MIPQGGYHIPHHKKIKDILNFVIYSNGLMKKLLITFLILLATHIGADAQKWSLSTNAFDWAMLGTANAEAQVSVSQHISLNAGARYNPWKFRTSNPHLTIQNQQTTFYAGVRFWTWYVFSGWWIEAKGQFGSFSRSGIWRPALEQGTGVGGGLSFGYTFMVSEHINIDIGAGAWGGRKLTRKLYGCPSCMNLRDEGPKNFIDLDTFKFSFMYVF